MMLVNGEGNKVKIQLQCKRGVWTVGFVGIAYSSARAEQIHGKGAWMLKHLGMMLSER